MYESIKYFVKNNVAWIVLNRPDKLNAFNAKMNEELKAAFKTASSSEEVRSILLTGEGRAFCSGQDLTEVDAQMDYGNLLRESYYPMLRQISLCEKPIVAAVNGVAAGAGFSLALACDFRLISEKGSYLNAFIHVGLVPDCGNMYYLSQLIGVAKTLELSILGEKVSAQQAINLGLANKIIEVQEWEDQLTYFAEHLASLPSKAVALIKRSMKAITEMPLEEYLEFEAQSQRIAGQTNDHLEGIEAFLEKRKPVFSGK
ncbi:MULTISPECIES: enoyl-CoA hydratase-related protein [unclassified Psychrobacillus]|uniref:enoyl-CoA hydratase-related protein n=1 Tax=unclassified Psychrobacillus TaxID=2636677 RepID=UPI0011A3B386|nr:enoyl-CoA hydratase-related protein [Psychrobacillus sp. AK 1817]QEY19530.1 2-(1,2-epoxy-1,2-dihydrophenyl)acetyl-CoA isomerase [Psychrobacillus sp. AK 1817]